jgi:hypothetical protein
VDADQRRRRCGSQYDDCGGDERELALFAEGFGVEVVAQEAFDPGAQAAGTGHGDCGERPLADGGKFEERLGIGGPAFSDLEGRVVAQCFAEFGEALLEPPAEGAEPENGAVDAGEKEQVEVRALDVGLLMLENNVQLGWLPLRGCGRQKDSRRYRYRSGNAGADADVCCWVERQSLCAEFEC